MQVWTKHNFAFDYAIVFQYPACYTALLAALSVESFTNTERIGSAESLNKLFKWWFVCESDTNTVYCITTRCNMAVYRSEQSCNKTELSIYHLNQRNRFTSRGSQQSGSVLMQVRGKELIWWKFSMDVQTNSSCRWYTTISRKHFGDFWQTIFTIHLRSSRFSALLLVLKHIWFKLVEIHRKHHPFIGEGTQHHPVSGLCYTLTTLPW